MDPIDNTRFDAALALLEERRFAEAVDAFSQLVAIRPELTGAYGNRGLAYLNLGRSEEARNDFETVLQLDPEDAMGHSMLAEISRFRGTPEETLAHVVDALRLDADEPQALFIRGWLFARSGQYAMAVEDVSRFLELAGGNEEGEDLLEACRILAAEPPVDENGNPLDTPEQINCFLGRKGWSFDPAENPDWQADGQSCPFAHCIRNRPSLSPEMPEGCPAFGYSCPGGLRQVMWCRDNQTLFD